MSRNVKFKHDSTNSSLTAIPCTGKVNITFFRTCGKYMYMARGKANTREEGMKKSSKQDVCDKNVNRKAGTGKRMNAGKRKNKLM